MGIGKMNSVILIAGGAAIVIAVGGFLSLGALANQDPDTPVIDGGELPNFEEPAVPDFRLPPAYKQPFSIQIDPTAISRVNPVIGMLELNRGDTRSVSIQIIPDGDLTSPTLLEVDQRLNDVGLPVVDLVGVDVSVQPREVLLKPGETSIVTITFNVNADAPDGAYHFKIQVLSEEFPGRLSGGFDVLIGDADPFPIDNPLVEEIEEISPEQLQDYINENWEVVKELEDGKFLVRRFVPAFGP